MLLTPKDLKTFLFRRTCAWLPVLLMVCLPVRAQHFNYRSFGQEDGIPQPYIYALVQDSAGYLWAGTGDGLVRFDGFGFESFSLQDSLADSFISAGACDGKLIWFGHMNGYCSLYDGRQFHRVRLPGSNGSPVTRMIRGRDGCIWASTYSDGLYRLSPDKDEIQRFTFIEPRTIVTFAFPDDHTLLIGTTEGLIRCRPGPGGRLEGAHTVSGIPADKVVDIEPAGKSAYYIATESTGIYLYDADGHVSILWKDCGPDSEPPRVQDILLDGRSNLWVATFGQGLLRFPGTTAGSAATLQQAERHLEEAVDIKVLLKDREGNVWTGNYGAGLTQILPRLFSIVPVEKPSQGKGVFSVQHDRDSWWLGTDKGLLRTDRISGKVLSFYGEPSLPRDTVMALCIRNENDIWIGTARHGVFRLEPASGKVSAFRMAEGGLRNSVTSMDKRGDEVWIGTRDGLCRINALTGAIRWYSIGEGGLPHNSVNCVYTDKEGRIWITTHSNILAGFDGEKLNRIRILSGDGNMELGPVVQDGKGLIWVGSMGSGVFRMEADTITNLAEKNGLYSNYCYSLYSDSLGNIWVVHRGGLSRITGTDFSIKPYRNIDRSGPVHFLPQAVDEDPRGILWFGSDKGMVRYDQARENRKAVPPLLGIRSIRINGEEWTKSGRIVLPPGNYRIRIDYLGISLEDPGLVNYQVQLQGYDLSPEFTKASQVTYNHLTEGKYVFTLSASNGKGTAIAEPLTVEILIKTPVWKKAWFYLLLLAFLIALTYLYIRRREYRFKTERRILEEKVEERTLEIQRQRDAIAQQRDMIRQKNMRITSSINYASHIQEAILPSPDLIKSLFPENFILSRPRDIVSGDFYWVAENKGKVVFAVGDCTGHGVPGAFLSILGITLLNELVNVEGIIRSDILITRFQEKLTHALRYTGNEYLATDGIDIALCIIDRLDHRIQYTGAMNDLVFIRKSQLDVLRANRISVSSGFDVPEVFTLQEFDYQQGDLIYLFSDGYPDQFGGPRNKKFSSRRMYAAFLEHAALPLHDQCVILEQGIDDWMRGYSQTDDITVMGVRL